MRLLLVDGTNLVIRYAAAQLPSLMGLADDVVESFAPGILDNAYKAIINCALSHAGCDGVIVALDSSESWRKAEYPDYKAGRDTVTLPWSNRFNAYLLERGLYCVRAFGFEADDIIATLVARAAKAGITTNVLSSDNDLLVLASLYCDVWQFGNRKAGESRFVKRPMAYVVEKYGLANAGQLRDYKALVGDPSDNLPGVTSIGPARALKVLSGATKLSADQLVVYEQMRRLVTLREDVPLDPILPSMCSIARVGRPVGPT